MAASEAADTTSKTTTNTSGEGTDNEGEEDEDEEGEASQKSPEAKAEDQAGESLLTDARNAFENIWSGIGSIFGGTKKEALPKDGVTVASDTTAGAGTATITDNGAWDFSYVNDQAAIQAFEADYVGQPWMASTDTPTASACTGGMYGEEYWEYEYDPNAEVCTVPPANGDKPPTGQTGEQPPPEDNKSWISKAWDGFYDLVGAGEGDKTGGDAAAGDGGGDGMTKVAGKYGEATVERKGDTTTIVVPQQDGTTAKYVSNKDGMTRTDANGDTITITEQEWKAQVGDVETTLNRETGDLDKVAGKQSFRRDKDGNITITDQVGDDTTKIEITKDGKVFQTLPDGVRSEITRQDLVTYWKDAITRQRRENLEDGQMEEEAAQAHADRRDERGWWSQLSDWFKGGRDTTPGVPVITTASENGAGLLQAENGQVTVQAKDGRVTVIMGQGEDTTRFVMDPHCPDQMMIKLQNGQRAFARYEDGKWQVTGGNGQDQVSVNSDGQLVVRGQQLQMVDGELRFVDSSGRVGARVDSQGRTSMTGGEGQEDVVFNPDGTRATAGAVTAEVTPGGQSTVSNGETTQKVDPNKNGAYETSHDGKVIQSQDETGMTTVPGELGIRYQVDDQGRPTSIWFDSDRSSIMDGKYIDHQGNELNIDYYSQSFGHTQFSDDMSVDPYGNMFYGDKYLGQAGDGTWGGKAAADASAAGNAAVSTAHAQVAALVARINAGEKVDPGALISVFSALGGAKAQAINAGAFDVIGAIDAAQAAVCAGINKGEVQVKLLENAEFVLKSLGSGRTLNATDAVNLVNQSGGSIAPDGLSKILDPSGQLRHNAEARLLDDLKNGDQQTQISAAKFLSVYGDERHQSALQEAARNGDQNVAREADASANIVALKPNQQQQPATANR